MISSLQEMHLWRSEANQLNHLNKNVLVVGLVADLAHASRYEMWYNAIHIFVEKTLGKNDLQTIIVERVRHWDVEHLIYVLQSTLHM